MPNLTRRRLSLTTLGLPLSSLPTFPASAADAPPRRDDSRSALPLEAFAELPRLTDAALSPDGRQLAALMHLSGDGEQTSGLVLRRIGDDRVTPLLRNDAGVSIAWIEWAGNERLLVGTRHLGRRDFDGTVETRLLSVRADGGGALNLVQPGPPGKFETQRGPQIQDRVVDLLPNDPQHILLELPPQGSASPGVYRVNIETGERRLIEPPQRRVWNWLTDARHRVRCGLRLDGQQVEVIACDPDGSRWRTLWRFEPWGSDAIWPLGFTSQPQELLVRAGHQGRAAIFRVDLSMPELPRRLLLAHPQRDVAGEPIHAVDSQAVIGLRMGDGTAFAEPRAELWNPQLRRVALEVDAALPDRRNRLLQFSRDAQRYLLHSSGRGQPGEYYLGDQRSGELVLLAEQHPRLPAQQLAGARRLAIRSRDGLMLEAFLTLPPGTPADAEGRPLAALPLVLLPHGGPSGRDDDNFDLWAEFIASRGCAVLQVNFRGSTGLGREFQHAGLRRWGLEMQDDLTDALQWAMDQRIADPKRLAIVGGSYGGYAALMGAVRTPELFRCVVSFAGVSDLIELIQHASNYFGGAEWAEASIGRLWGDRAQLRATSPALQAERIQAPVLLVHGSADRVVPVQHSRSMAAALQRARKPVRYVEQDGGNHHLGSHRHRLAFFRLLAGFLGEHLGLQS
jgi:dipeptidyl aminopeptidase/acylaminoacyl peptidase